MNKSIFVRNQNFKKMKFINSTILLTILATVISLQLAAQDYRSLTDEDFAKYPHWIAMMQDHSVNFYDVQHAFEVYWKDREITKGSGWKPFKRWEYMMASRVNADGSRPAPDHNLKAWNNYLDEHPQQKSEAGNWENLGPFLVPPNKGYRGLGRLNAIAFHPTDPQTIFVGAPSGGLWITHTHGNDWYTTTDNLPTLGVSAIAVDFDDPDIIYIGTGDRDANDAPGMGIFKSFDGGQTWDHYNFAMGNAVVGQLIMHPENSETLLAATSSGIFKTSNGGELWESKISGNFKELVYKPDDFNTMYASAGGSFYRSDDQGENWVLITNGIPPGSRGVIGVSPANPNVVYFLQSQGSVYGGTYLSNDAGLSFTVMSTTPNIMSWGCNGGDGGQAWYDLDMCVDPFDANIIFAGGVNCFKSSDAGTTWQISSHWWGDCGVAEVHADLHILEYNPINNRLYVGNDGGIYWTDNIGETWNLISNGLSIGQVYKIGQSATVKDKVINGYQDNGTSTYMGTEDWYFNYGGDGMECAVDHENATYSYATLYYGDIFRIVNNGNTGKIAGNGSHGINESGAWVTPFLLHETDATTMFVGYKNIWRGTNVRSGSPTWVKISDNPGGNGSTNWRVLEHSPADLDLMYAGRDNNTFFRSDNVNSQNPSWINLSPALPENTSINDFEAHPTNPDIVYMCQGQGVYKSENRGQSWTDITGTLPAVSKNDIAFYINSQEGLYVGTDVGIYYRDAFMDDWLLFGNGFPASARVTELEIYYEAGDPSGDVIRAATYGRGLWSSDMYRAAPTADFSANYQTAPPDCGISFSDNSEGVPSEWFWTFEGGTPATSTERNPTGIEFENPGSYTVSLSVTNQFGSDTKVMENFILIDDELYPEIEFSASTKAVCSGETVYFYDETTYCPNAWNWSFVPDDVIFVENTTAQSPNPAVVFQSNQSYSVTLTATNSNGNASLEKEAFIYAGGYTMPFTSDFSDGFETQNWQVNNADLGITWDVTTPAWSPNGNQAAWINLFDYSNLSQRDELISPPINLQEIEDPFLNFNYAYTYKFVLRDSLIIKISTDCGENWERIFATADDGSGNFATAEPANVFFNPASADDWCGSGYGANCISLSLAEYVQSDNVKIMFEARNRYGNNLYITDIEITSPTLLENMVDISKEIKIIPNPNKGIFTIRCNSSNTVLLEIINYQGKIIKHIEAIDQATIDLQSIPKGVYFVKMYDDGKIHIEKMIVQ
jgi:PKD repeat protein/photosystem II stability/assembly factor-like uncharacterized protein